MKRSCVTTPVPNIASNDIRDFPPHLEFLPLDTDAVSTTQLSEIEPCQTSTIMSQAESTKSTKSSEIWPEQHKDFLEKILKPRGIEIEITVKVNQTTVKHFGRPPPEQGYTKLSGLEDVEVWTTHTVEQRSNICDEYQYLKDKNFCEMEFQTLALSRVFHSPPKHSDHQAEHEDRAWVSERLLGLRSPAQELGNWRTPPVLQGRQSLGEFTWELSPDCAYWLSLRHVDPQRKHTVVPVCFVQKSQYVCPYLTVEFKRSGQGDDVATVQAAAAGSIALYNRYLLWKAATEDQKSNGATAEIKHYTFTFIGPEWNVWQIQPKSPAESYEWIGCTMSKISQGDCTIPADLVRLEQWINEIHRWGLTEHAESCRSDIRKVLQAHDVKFSQERY